MTGFTRLLCCAFLGLSIGFPVWADEFDERLFLEAEGEVALIEGTIGPDSLWRVQTFLDEHPEVQILVLIDMPGSIDDETNLLLARLVRDSGLDTFVPSEGQIASGAVDLFLAGNRRFAECGAGLGVHSWADGEGVEGGDLPRDHRDHSLYLDYYAEMGIDPQFYWFTLKAAAADSIYFMKPNEIERFALVTDPMGC